MTENDVTTTEHYGTWAEFCRQIEDILERKAREKGYSTSGIDGVNPLYELVASVAHGPGHALGECIYKAIRYGEKGNPEDLIKAAAWCFLAWRHHRD